MSKISVKPPKPSFAVFSVEITAKLLIMKTDTSQVIFQCGNISIEPQTGMVKNTLDRVRLGPVNMQVLITLLESSGQVVSRSQIFDRVWKNQIVSDDTLTRCISDLRSQLRVFSEFEDVIETLPKRGYRWLAKVNLKSQSTSMHNIIEPEQLSVGKTWRHYLTVGMLGIVMMLLLSTSVLWITEQIIRPDLIRIALLPIHYQKNAQQTKAQQLDELLRTQLLKTDKLRFLSNSAIDKRPDNPFPYLTHQFGTQWIIEGDMRSYQDKVRITLNLVDATTAMVTFSITADVGSEPETLQLFSKTFVEEMVKILGLESQA